MPSCGLCGHAHGAKTDAEKTFMHIKILKNNNNNKKLKNKVKTISLQLVTPGTVVGGKKVVF